jgi:hypothetical protein
MIALQLGFTYLPIMNRLFHTEAIGLEAWAGIVAAAVVAHAVVGLQKFLANRLSLKRTDWGSDEPGIAGGVMHEEGRVLQ